jgi:hypothetical protein
MGLARAGVDGILRRGNGDLKTLDSDPPRGLRLTRRGAQSRAQALQGPGRLRIFSADDRRMSHGRSLVGLGEVSARRL